MIALSASLLLLWPSPAQAESPDVLGCPLPSTPPSYHRRAIGYGSGKKAKALREAEAEARRTLLTETTGGFSNIRRDPVKAHIGITQAHYGRMVCAAADVDQRRVEGLEADAQQYESDVRDLAAAITENLGGGILQLEYPTWAESGCVASIGPTLSAALRNALASHSVLLISKGTSNPAATRLRLTLAAETSGVLLSASLSSPKRGVDTPLNGFRLPLDLFDTIQDEWSSPGSVEG